MHASSHIPPSVAARGERVGDARRELFLGEPHGSPRNVWRGRATALDATPHGVRVSVDGPLPLVAEITPSAVADLGLAGGEDVWVSFKASEVDVYPA